MNRLKAYVRRTILASAKEGASYYTTSEFKPTTAREAKARALKEAFRDAAHGTDTGWWNDLIYTDDVRRLAHQYRRDIANVAYDYAYDAGADADVPLGAVGNPSLFRIVHACAVGFQAADDSVDDALQFGLRFAVEWLTHEVASELGVEL